VHRIGVHGIHEAGPNDSEESLIGDDSVAKPRLVREDPQSSQTPENYLDSKSEDAVTIEISRLKYASTNRNAPE
jgi:hypothetical protein